METLMALRELKAMSEKLKIPFLTHFFTTFDNVKSVSLQASYSQFKVQVSLNGVDYRSAYHQLCDWLYGWDASDATEFGEKLSFVDHFSKTRPIRDIKIHEEWDNQECERNLKIFETLFGMTKRQLRKSYIDFAEDFSRVSTNCNTMNQLGKDKEDELDDELEEHDIEQVWNTSAKTPSSPKKPKTANSEKSELDDDKDNMDDHIMQLLKMSNQEKSRQDSENDLNEVKPEIPIDVKVASAKVSVESLNENIATNNPEKIANMGRLKMNLESEPEKKIDMDEESRLEMQTRINRIYVKIDRATNQTISAILNCLIIMALSELLNLENNFERYHMQANEIAMDFVSTELKTIWDLIRKEIPHSEMELSHLRNPTTMGRFIQRVIDLRAVGGVSPRFKIRKLHKKITLIHELLTSIDINILPNFVVAHKEGCKVARYSIFDNSIWLTAGYDGVIRIFDLRPLAKTKCLGQYVGHKSIVTDAHLFRKDTFIFSCSFDRTLKLWNAQNSNCERTFVGHTDSVTSCHVSPDGRYAVSGGLDNTVRIWDINTGECLGVAKKHTRWVKVVRFSPDGRFVASAGLDRKIIIWETKALIAGKVTLCYKVFEDHTDYILDLVFGTVGVLYTTSRDCSIRAFDYVAGITNGVIEIMPSWACSISLSENGEYLACSTFDNNVLIFRTLDLKLVRTIRVFNLGINCVSFPKDLSYLVLGTNEGYLQQIML